MKFTLLCASIVCAVVAGGYVFGANENAFAPPIPSTYVAAHPRLGFPDNAYLDKIWNNAAIDCTGMISWVKGDADAWNSTNPGTDFQGRHLLIAYQAAKRHGGTGSTPSCVATYLTKIQNTATHTSGGSLAGFYGPTFAAVAYDWTYADLGPTAQANYLSALLAYGTAWNNCWIGQAYSPYNDQAYIDMLTRCGNGNGIGLITALAAYPDDKTAGFVNLQFAMSVFFNQMEPAWRHVMQGANCDVNHTADNLVDCGGGWHEGWQDYFVSTSVSQDHWIFVNMLAWANASGIGVTNYFNGQGSYFKNLGYWMIYHMRPDMSLIHTGQQHFPNLLDGNSAGEYNALFGGSHQGFMEGIASVYNSAAFRGIARLADWQGTIPNGNEPSAWPYLPPDSNANSVQVRWPAASASAMTLAKTKNFPGVGEVHFLSNFSEDGTQCFLTYGDSYWSHDTGNAGAVDCYMRGNLIGSSGNYAPGSDTTHDLYWESEAVSRSTILLCSSADSYPQETFTQRINAVVTQQPFPNDCGQRRIGSGFNTGGAGNKLQPWMQAPLDPAQLSRGRSYYHKGKLVGFGVDPSYKWSYAAVDITAAYNNNWSKIPYSSSNLYAAFTANTANRQDRAEKVVRNVVFIPRGNAAYLVVYDQIRTTAANILKKILWHTINQPTLGTYTCAGGATCNSWTSLRTENATALPSNTFSAFLGNGAGSTPLTHCTSACASYQYDGKVYAYQPYPTTAPVPTVIGGPGHEFEFTDYSTGVTTNWNQCGDYGGGNLCNAGAGTGSTPGIITNTPGQTPIEVMGWRVEAGTGTTQQEDQIIHVFLLTTSGDTNVMNNLPTTVFAGGVGTTTWTDNGGGCIYTVTSPQFGVGGTVTVKEASLGSGACVGGVIN